MKNNNGFVLVLSVLVLSTLLLLGTYLISIADSESKISNAQSTATANYYLAEAGVNEMFYKIQNDQSTGDDFLAGTLTSASDINRSNVFGDSNASYVVTAISTAPTEAWIIATSTYQLGTESSRRVVKAYITQATGSGAEWDFSSFAGGRGSQQNGNFTFTGSGVIMTANGGRLHSNQDFKVQSGELIVNDGAVSSSNNILEIAGGEITLNNSYSDAPTTTEDMLQIDFDSSDPQSWKNRADQVYTNSQFSALPSGTTLNGITYVTGKANITGKSITINGVLVADDDISITLSGQTLTVNTDVTVGGGILSKQDVNFTTSAGTINIEGLIYAADDLEIVNSGAAYTIDGSLAGFDAKITRSGGTITLNYVPENFQAVIDPANNPTSPVIQIDHWEEQY